MPNISIQKVDFFFEKKSVGKRCAELDVSESVNVCEKCRQVLQRSPFKTGHVHLKFCRCMYYIHNIVF